MKILGIETSCDETAVAVINSDRTIHANLIKTQIEEHADYVGVVPEIAARAHLDYLDLLLKQLIKIEGCSFKDLDGVAVTSGPGLIGGVISGVMAAKAIAMAHNLPIIGINHLEGHLLTPRLTDPDLEFPYLVLLVSGGHSQILIAHSIGNYERLATTVDDAVGEAFDKSAKLMGLGYPGGPNVEKQALLATNSYTFDLPRPKLKNHALNFSFSGLKTAVKRHAEKHIHNGHIDGAVVQDLCANLQNAIGDVLYDRVKKALVLYKEKTKTDAPAFVVCGGVAANQSIRARLTDLCADQDTRFYAPPLRLCGDNAAMIAWAGIEHFKQAVNLSHYTHDKISPRPRWPLDEDAKAVIGSSQSKSGRKV